MAGLLDLNWNEDQCGSRIRIRIITYGAQIHSTADKTLKMRHLAQNTNTTTTTTKFCLWIFYSQQ